MKKRTKIIFFVPFGVVVGNLIGYYLRNPSLPLRSMVLYSVLIYIISMLVVAITTSLIDVNDK